MTKMKKRKVGDVWRAKRKIGKHRRNVLVKKLAKGKYRVRVTKAKNKHVNRGRGYLLDRAHPYSNKAEPWERR